MSIQITFPDGNVKASDVAVSGFAEGKSLSFGKVANPIRVVGMAISPPVDKALFLLGCERALKRLNTTAVWQRQ